MASITLFALCSDEGTYSQYTIALESRDKGEKEYSDIVTILLPKEDDVHQKMAYFVWPPQALTFYELSESAGLQHTIYEFIHQALIRIDALRE